MNKKELKELLNSLSSQLRAEIEGAQTELKNAKSITTQINNLFTKSTELVSKFENPETGFNTKLEQATLDTTKLSETATTAEKTLTDIQTSLTTVQQNINSMQTAYTEFQALKTKIDEPTTGLEAILTQSTQLLAQITTNSSEATTLTDTIKQNLTTVQDSITKMQTAYTEFQALKTKIDDPKTGLEVTLEDSQTTKADIDAIKQESETVYKEISRYKETAAANSTKIEELKTSSEKALEAITNNQTESEELKEKISDIFEIASRSGHANYFDERRKRLEKISWCWLGGAIFFIAVAVALAILVIVPLTKSTQHNVASTTFQELIVRFSVITPFLALGIFGASNYAKERRLAEHYAFRAVSALSIEGSLLLLDRALADMSSEDKNSQIINFAVSTMKMIYSEPQEQSKSTRVHLRGGNKLVQVGAELNQKLEVLTDAIIKDNVEVVTKDSK